VSRATKSERRRRVASLVLIAMMLMLCVQAESIHRHAGAIHHRDCPICKAAIAAHGLVPGAGVTVAQPQPDFAGRIHPIIQADVLEAFGCTSGARAPPEG
jgi:hypothetical protein